MNVTIMQPAYLPWLGYFHRIMASDLFIVLDHVQIDKNSKTGFAHRNKVRTREGWGWLTVPLKTKGKKGELFLNQIELVEDQPWAAKHWETLKHNYGRAPFFRQHAGALEGLYARKWERLADLTREFMAWQLAAFNVRTPLMFSSEMSVPGNKDELILNLCRAAGASVYISGPFGRDYLREDLFSASGITVVYHDYQHPVYPQVYPGFEPYMAAVDLLLNCGPDSLQILRAGNEAFEESLRGDLLRREGKCA
jgi:WbqC-like protein family